VTAPTAQLARELLEKRGWTDLTLISDDILSELAAKNQTLSNLSAEKYVEYQRKGKITFREYVMTVARDVAFLAVVCGLAVAWKLSRHQYLGAFLFALPVVVLTAIFARIRLNGYLFTRLNEVSEWRRADETLRLLDRLSKTLKPEDISFYRSKALIWKGEVAAGLADWRQHESKLSPSFFLCRLSGLHEAAEDIDCAIELSEKALALSPNTGAYYIDMAWKYPLLRANLPRAKELMEQAERLEHSEILKPFLIRNRAIVALRDGRAEEAEKLLLETLAILDSNKGMHFRHSNIMLTKGFLCLARAKQGKIAQARADFAEAKEWLTAAKVTPLLKACEAI
jgi:tetratricopeptide (TPR) repeat protein